MPNISLILYSLYCEYQLTPRQRRDPLLYWPRALFLICRLLAGGLHQHARGDLIGAWSRGPIAVLSSERC